MDMTPRSKRLLHCSSSYEILSSLLPPPSLKLGVACTCTGPYQDPLTCPLGDLWPSHSQKQPQSMASSVTPNVLSIAQGYSGYQEHLTARLIRRVQSR